METVTDLIWVEKHRPKTFDEIIGLPTNLKELVEQHKPHLLLVGPPGVGKTSTAKVVINYLNAEYMKLNASDERGIDTIRDAVKSFCRGRSLNGNIKIVFLDEADALTPDAQLCLRSMLEEYAKTTRFILTANYEQKLIEPLRSRCMTVQFKPASHTEIVEKLGFIGQSEGLNVNEEELRLIVDATYPDIRAAINLLQRSSVEKLPIQKFLAERQTFVTDLLAVLRRDGFIAAEEYVVKKGIPIETLLMEIRRAVIKSELPIATKADILEDIGEAMYRATVVLDSQVLLGPFFYRLAAKWKV